MNFAGIVVETVADHIGQTSYVRDFEVRMYGTGTWRYVRKCILVKFVKLVKLVVVSGVVGVAVVEDW